MRILFIGSCSSFFLVPLAKALRAENPDVFLGVYGLNKPAGELNAADKAPFDHVISPIQGKLASSKKERLKAVWSLVKRNKEEGAFFEAALSGKLKAFITQKETELIEINVQEQIASISENYDLVQVHYLKERNLKLVEKVAPQRLLLSFWGSDLMQDEAPQLTQKKKELLQSCAGISIHGADLAFIACVKYGWNLKSKFSFALFPLNQVIFDGLDRFTQNDGKQFLTSFGAFDPGKRLVAMGYNAHPRFQHKAIIEHISTLDDGLMAQLHFVFTFAYGSATEEQKEIINCLEKHHCSYTVIDRYLEDEEVALLRKACDVFMFLTDSDAFSGTMIEYLYAGAQVITGTWLPFGKLRRAGIDFTEVEDVLDLNSSELLHSRLSENQLIRVKALISSSAPGKHWLAMYQKIIRQQQQA